MPVDLTLPTGQVAAVLGRNGAGETTRVGTLGPVPRDRQVRVRDGAVLQDSSTPEGLTATEVIRLVGRYYPYRLPIDDVLERAGLTAKRGARVGQLTGGRGSASRSHWPSTSPRPTRTPTACWSSIAVGGCTTKQIKALDGCAGQAPQEVNHEPSARPSCTGR